MRVFLLAVTSRMTGGAAPSGRPLYPLSVYGFPLPYWSYCS